MEYSKTQNLTFEFGRRFTVDGSKKIGVAGVISVLVLALGCAANSLVNKSPTPVLPQLINYIPIQSTVYVKDAAGGSAALDVASALEKNRVFAQVTTDSNQAKRAAFVLQVKSEIESDHHFAEEMGEAVISGLTLGLADFFQDTQFEYTVKVQATLVSTDGQTIGEYVGEGSFHSTTPELNFQKIIKVEKTVLLSWEHALNELSIRLMQDRENITGQKR